jgi:hypothetical protein
VAYLPTLSITLGVNFPPDTAGVVDTGGQLTEVGVSK